MRYLKVLLFALIFFISMIFFFQNQPALDADMTLRLNLFFIPPMESLALPFYFLVMAAFLLGALLAVCVLVWDKMSLSARCMKATWRVRSLEKELEELKEKYAAKELALETKEEEEKATLAIEEKKDEEKEESKVEIAKDEETKEEEKKDEKKDETKQRQTSATPEDFS